MDGIFELLKVMLTSGKGSCLTRTFSSLTLLHVVGAKFVSVPMTTKKGVLSELLGLKDCFGWTPDFLLL